MKQMFLLVSFVVLSLSAGHSTKTARDCEARKL